MLFLLVPSRDRRNRGLGCNPNLHGKIKPRETWTFPRFYSPVPLLLHTA